MSDPIAPHSAPISAYMSVHEATNLAYVRYFGKVDHATKATFKSLSSTSFTLDYELPNDTQVYQAIIPFKEPLKTREEIRPVLEAMAKEAETHLGLPSSLSGPPPIKAIAKALVASTEVYTPPAPVVPLNSYYLPTQNDMVHVTLFLSVVALLANTSDDYLQRQFPSFILSFRNVIGKDVLLKFWNGLVVAHAAESVFTFVTCVRRGWYSPFNTLKWTVSTFFFGYGSLRKLKKHAKDVAGSK